MSVSVKTGSKNTFKSMLNYEWIVMNIPFFLFLAFIAILYIANGHLTDKTIRKINATKRDLKQLQFEYKTLKAELMHRSESIQIERMVAPFGLMVGKEMPITLPLENRISTQKEIKKAR